MTYNIAYEVCAVIILVIVFLHVQIRNNAITFSNRVFLLLVGVGIADIILDIASTIMICAPEIYPVLMQSLTLHILYVLQLVLPYILFTYVISLQNSRYFQMKNAPGILLASSPFLIMLAIVLTNCFTKRLFYFDGGGNYLRGPMYLCMYFYGLFYLLLTVLFIVINHKKMNRRQYLVIWEFVIVNIVFVGIQMFFNDVLLTGVGIAIAIIIMILTINNPYERLDTLTGLFDSVGLEERLEEYSRGSRNYRIIVIAFDNLKRINLVFGIGEGNRQIKKFAELLVVLFGRENAFRFIGDRFVVLCESEEVYERGLEQINEYFQPSHKINGVEVKLSVCICKIPEPLHQKNTEKLLVFIDYLVEQAKKSGSGTIVEADAETETVYLRRQEIEAYLLQAVEEKLFEVYYQPVYSTKEKRFISAEALVRLRHPQLGMISPAEFIPIAESSGEITRVEDSIFHKVCLFMKNHPEIFEEMETLKFNLSPAMFLNASLDNNILTTMKEYGIKPSLFQFEITETVATVYDKELMLWVEKMKTAGAGLCLDDFGSGFANLDVTLKLPFDVVKLDRSILLEAAIKKKSRIMYEDIVRMMHRLGFKVVAEGAETKADILFLKEIGVNYIQGYYYSKPIPETDFLKLLKKQSQERKKGEEDA